MAVACALLLSACDDVSYRVDGTANPDAERRPPSDTLLNDAEIANGTGVDGLPAIRDVLAPIQEPSERGVGSFVQVSSGAAHACGLTPSGDPHCWGSDFGGESTHGWKNVSYTQVVTGNIPAPSCPSSAKPDFLGQCGFSCGLSPTGEVFCWGSSFQGPPGAATFVQIAAGAFACGLRYDGSAVCFGEAPPPSPPDVFTQISVGGAGSVCALKENGDVMCWGADLGPAPRGPFKQVSVGSSFACGLAADTSIACWGRPAGGAPPPSGQGFSSVSVGAEHACALRQGVVSCWGSNEWLQSEVPDVRFASVSAGGNHTCAIEPNGGVMCWGMVRMTSRKFNKLSASGPNICGIGLDGLVSCWGLSRRIPRNPTRVPFKEVSTASATSCGIQSNGQLMCWSLDHDAKENETLPTGSFLRLDLTERSSSQPFLGAIKDDGTLVAWKRPGDDSWQLPKLPASGKFTALAVDHRGFLCALAEDKSVGCWDANGAMAVPTGKFMHLDSRLKDGPVCAIAVDGRFLCWNPYNLFESTQRPGTFVELSFGFEQGCGLAVDGQVTCWGSDISRPPPPDQAMVSISAGWYHACSLDRYQRPWCWGDYVMYPM